MKTQLITGLLCALALLGSETAIAQAVVGKPAPSFTATDAAGKPVSMASLKGKYVVLEWINPGCPFVQKHYDGGNMPNTQSQALAKGAVWVAIQTIPTNTDDAKAHADLQAWLKTKNSLPTTTIIDSSGTIGQAYGARTTPHMYVVNPEGTLIYAGAIDSKPSANPADIASATNYVTQALGEAMAGKALSQAVTQPYGCSVKYPSGS